MRVPSHPSRHDIIPGVVLGTSAGGNQNFKDVQTPLGTYRRVPSPGGHHTPGTSVFVGLHDPFGRRRPVILGSKGGILTDDGELDRIGLAWLSWGLDARRGHAQSSGQIQALEGSDLDITFPIHYRTAANQIFAYREVFDDGEPVRSLATSSGQETSIEKVWHDMLITSELDSVIGLESDADSATTAGHPTDGRFTEGIVCVMCREVDLSFRWETCLGMFGVEIDDDGGIGIGVG